MNPNAATAATPLTGIESWWPFFVLLASVAFIIIAISRWRWHSFLALTSAALLAGVLAWIYPHSTRGADGLPVIKSLVQTVDLAMTGFGQTAASIALSIGLASLIGMCLMESGAADKVVRRFLALFGEKNAGWALLWSTYVLSVPIFFDTMFMLMAPLAMALRLRTGKDYLLYVMAICIGGVITHSMTIPHPGPIAMQKVLNVDTGLSILFGFVAGIIPAALTYLVATKINALMPVELRETPGTSRADLQKIVDQPESELPSLVAALTPVILPIFLISTASFLVVAEKSSWGGSVISALGGPESFLQIKQYIDYIGNKNIALAIGTICGLWLLVKRRGLSREALSALMNGPLETAGVIILITSAGGAFGAMIKNAGVGPAVERLASGHAVSLLLLGYILALVIRVAQGSATVAMLTTASIIAPMIPEELGYSKLYLFLSIGFGAFSASWMNDSGFWVVSRLGGLTERETLRSWTVVLTVASFIGFIITWLCATLLPLAHIS
jgi:GntP family gluconate:H+ symporter